MFPVMKEAHKFNGYLFVVMLTLMVIYSLPKVGAYLDKEIDTVSLYFDGQLARDFEQDYDKALFLREVSVEGWANFRYFLFNEGLDGVVIGSDQWLFTKEEFEYTSNLDQSIQPYMSKIKEINDLLSAKGKTLIILPVPMKAAIYSEYTPFFAQSNSGDVYDLFIEKLSKEGIASSPIQDVFLAQKNDTQLFLKKDTHWTPAGASIAAHVLAENFPSLVGEAEYQTQPVAQKQFSGDLLNFVKISQWADPDLLTGENLQELETTKVSGDEDQSLSLFGDQDLSIALVGTSYTAIDDWNFPGFMREALQQDIVSVAVKEKGPFVAMDLFFEGEFIDDPSIETVIWEFPVRSLIKKQNHANAWQTMMDSVF